MNVEVIRAALRRQPFRPFALFMNDGEEFKVEHPELVTLTRRDVTLTFPREAYLLHLEPVLIARLRESMEGEQP